MSSSKMKTFVVTNNLLLSLITIAKDNEQEKDIGKLLSTIFDLTVLQYLFPHHYPCLFELVNLEDC